MLNYKIGQKSNLKLPHHNHFSQVKLPLLDKKPNQTFKKSLSKIRSGKLPLVHLHDSNMNEAGGRADVHQQQQQNNEMEVEMGGNFAQQIGERVNSILNKNHMFNMDYYASQSQNFQLNIAKNKEYLKGQRGKRMSVLRKKDMGQESPKEDSKWREVKRKEDRLKVASRSKRKNKSPGVGNSKSESVLSNDSSGQNSKGKGGLTNRLEKKMHQLKKKLGNRKKGESKLATQGDVQDAKSQNLFDNIHNYLANPQRLSFDSKDPVSTKLAKRKKDLEAKLKIIQQKIANLDQEIPTTQDKRQKIQLTGRNQDGVSDWRRMEFNRTGENKRKYLTMRESDFQKEVNHINHLQQRNQQSLERYLDNQRILFDLKLMRSSKEQPREFRSK